VSICKEISREKEIFTYVTGGHFSPTSVNVDDSCRFVQGEIVYGGREFILVFIPTRSLYRGFNRLVIFSKVPSKLSSLEITSEVLSAGTGISGEIVGDKLVWNSDDLPVSLLAVLKLWKGKDIVNKTGIG
jgi:hypothetical protein